MGRWTPDEHGCIYDEAGCFARLTPNKAERLASRHNADIDALTAERDELQRRLDEVVKSLEPGECKDWLGGYWLQKHTLWTRAVAIAEGKMTPIKPKSTPFDPVPHTVVLLDDVELDSKGRAIITREHYSQLRKEFDRGV